VDTDRERDIALLEVQEENRKLVEEFYRARLGKRAQRMMANAETNRRHGDDGSEDYAAGAAAADAAAISY
jgi:hypothetical protein